MSGALKTSSRVPERLRRVRVALAVLCAALIATAAYWAWRPSCADDTRGFVGEVKRQADGKLVYFDGRCWTPKPIPPTDTPF